MEAPITGRVVTHSSVRQRSAEVSVNDGCRLSALPVAYIQLNTVSQGAEYL